MKFYLIPQNKLHLAEDRMEEVGREQRRAWSGLLNEFKTDREREDALAYSTMLMGLRSVSLKNGLLLLKDESETAIPARHLIMMLASSEKRLSRAAEKFLRKLKEIEKTSVPEANAHQNLIVSPLSNSLLSFRSCSQSYPRRQKRERKKSTRIVNTEAQVDLALQPSAKM
jgi:hypothetical protein